ncbi:MAG: RraA family protein [Verrucomicrobia bacterium]|nr:RraA family protein [Verrucomicrobiota bacterium]
MSERTTPKRILTHGQLLQMKRWNTPTVYNGWEQITRRDSSRDCFNLEETRDFMPQMGPMVGYAITLVIEPSNPRHRESNPNAFVEYFRYAASVPPPQIVVVQDLEKPNTFGAGWGEVMANLHKALGCVGTITDGAIRDVEWMTNAGFKALARRLCVGHAKVCPARWNCTVEVFGRRIEPGNLIHADQHGFLVIPDEDQARLLDALRFMDNNECDTLISAGRAAAGQSTDELVKNVDGALKRFRAATRKKFSGRVGY